MTSERGVRGIAGVLVLASVALGLLHHRNWLYFTGFVGLVMLQSFVTDRCPARWILEKAGLPRCGPTPTPPPDGNTP